MHTVLRGLTAPFFTLLLLVGLTGSSSSQTVVVLTSDSLTSTRRAVSGARSIVRSRFEEAKFVTTYFRPDDQSISRQIDSINTLNPDVILTVGSAATRIAKQNFDQTPIVFSAVMYPTISGFVESANRPGDMITGASLDIAADVQFRYFRQIVPDLQRLGVIYTSNTAPLIPPARIIAADMGLELVAVQVSGPKDIPRALDSLSASVQGLWSVADQNLFDPQSTKYILLNSLRRGLPFMGFSRYVVESGALFALDFDYKAIGRQAGGLINKVLSGSRPGALPVTSPDIRWFHYNEKTAKHINVTIPPDLVAIAKEVYR